MNTATVGMAVTPTVFSTFMSHYLNRKPLKQRPTAHLSYDEGLSLIRAFMAFASQHTVEDLQAFTAQWVPHPQWVKVDDVDVPADKIDEAGRILADQLGPEGIKLVGGTQWWQWRKPDTPLAAEWIEMRSDYNARKKADGACKRVMFYIHGGAYYFGSVDEHRYQLQRHARKLQARVFAPNYRLAPQFPFPSGLQDCLAAYLYLLTVQDPTTIVFAGDSAGGGMVLSLLVMLRDRGLPLPAGAVLISPWVDLTHSFPSVSMDCPFDYIPQHGFHHKPSNAWPPLNHEEEIVLREQVAKEEKKGKTGSGIKALKKDAAKLDALKQKRDEEGKGEAVEGTLFPEDVDPPKYLSINLDGKDVYLKDQIQMYTTNELLAHPLVSPIMQPTLGGLPPLLILVGGGEILRDEQIYVAHKCANPAKYAPREGLMDDFAREQLARFKPTDVQLQIWDDLCHVVPTLSFTRPAKHMFRSVAQFSAWALARAQKTDIDILDDDDISVISSSGSDSEGPRPPNEPDSPDTTDEPRVGKAGDELPPFKNHMIRQRVNRHGRLRTLEAEDELPACKLTADEVGVIKEGPVRKWLAVRSQSDIRFQSARAKVHKRRLKEMMAGYQVFEGECPPPSALAGRRKLGDELGAGKKRKSMGLSLWSLWGSKHDQATKNREQQADKVPDHKTPAPNQGEGSGARSPRDLKEQEKRVANRPDLAAGRSPSRRRTVRDEQQTGGPDSEDARMAATALAELMAKRTAAQPLSDKESAGENAPLNHSPVPPATGATGKRPMVEGIAVPFTINKEAETASMITLTSNAGSRVASPSPTSPKIPAAPATPMAEAASAATTLTQDAAQSPSPNVSAVDDMEEDEPVTAGTPRTTPPTAVATTAKTTEVAASDIKVDAGTPQERPPLDTFVTALEDLPKAQ